MATAQEVREEIRVAIGDDDYSDEVFSDFQLNIFIRAALRRLKNKVALSITISNGAFSSAPTDAQADLISLQAQCLISQRQFRGVVDKGVKITSETGDSVDTTAGFGGWKESAMGPFSACGMLEDAVADYIQNNPDLSIESVTSKYATNTWAGTQHLYEDVTFNGDGEDRLWHQGRGGRRSTGESGDYNDQGRFSQDV